MKLKLFAERDTEQAEKKVNAWFIEKKSKMVVSKTQVALSNVHEENGGTTQNVLIAVWYSDVSN